MAVLVAQRQNIYIQHQDNVKFVQYHVATFNLSSASSYGSGAYGYHSYGSSVAVSTNTPEYGSYNSDVNLVYIDNILYNKVYTLNECLSTSTSFFYDSSDQKLYINFINNNYNSIILYPDIQNSPIWSSASIYVKDAGVWKQSTVYTRVSGTWVQVT